MHCLPSIEGWRSLPNADASAFKTSKVLSLAAAPNRSTSGPLLSKDQTLTRLLVDLWVADCTRHKPTLKGGTAVDGGAGEEDPEGDGLSDRVVPIPMLYDCEIAVRPKKEVAAASIGSSDSGTQESERSIT